MQVTPFCCEDSVRFTRGFETSPGNEAPNKFFLNWVSLSLQLWRDDGSKVIFFLPCQLRCPVRPYPLMVTFILASVTALLAPELAAWTMNTHTVSLKRPNSSSLNPRLTWSSWFHIATMQPKQLCSQSLHITVTQASGCCARNILHLEVSQALRKNSLRLRNSSMPAAEFVSWRSCGIVCEK